MSDNDLKSEYSDLYRDYSSSWDAFLLDAELFTQMHLGAHFSKAQIKQASLVGRTLYPFNKTARQVALLEGEEISNRHVLKIGPVGKEDDLAANQHTGIIMQQMAAGGYDVMSACFKWGSLVSGSNLLEIYNDREGRRQFRRLPYNSFFLDPAFTKADLSDCRNILIGRWLHEDNVKMLLPTEVGKISSINSISGSRWRDNPDYARLDYMRLYEEWWSLDTYFDKMVINKLTGQQMKLTDFQKHPQVGGASAATDIIDKMRQDNGAPVWSKYDKPFKRIRLRCFVDEELVWDGFNPTKIDEYNHVWFGGEFCPEADRFDLRLRSMTAKLYWPQTARDKRMNQILDIIENAIQSAKVVKEGSLVNKEDAYKSGQTGPIFVKAKFTGPVSDAIHQLSGPQIPAGLFQAVEMIDKDETTAAGFNEEILGDDNKDIPHILAKFRSGQALKSQGGIFQTFRAAKRQLGIKMVKMNQIWKSPQAVKRHLQERPAPGFYKPDFARFDCNPTEGLLTDSQRQLYFWELKALYEMFPNHIPPSLVISNAPIQQPQELLQAVKAQEQQQSKMMAQQLQTKNVMEQMMLAQAQLDQAKARGEITDASYDRAKTLVEMQKIQSEPELGLIDRYLQYITIMEQGRQNRLQAAQTTAQRTA